jgi:cleavage and polyadenylation specificity factor subunit 3
MAKRTADGLPAGLKVDAIVTSAGLVQHPANTSRPIEDEIQVQMLGSGQEVGRSCCLLKYRGRTIVCDAGSHPGLPGMSALPYLDEVDWSTVDAILITQSVFLLAHAMQL